MTGFSLRGARGGGWAAEALRSQRRDLYLFPGIAVTNYHRLGAKMQRFLYVGLGSQKSEIKIVAGLGPSGRSEGENAFHASLPASVRWLLPILGFPWPVDVLSRPASIFPLPPSLGHSMSFPLIRTPVVGFRAHPKSSMLLS